MKINWNNVSTFHHRILANFLRKRGWIVFYLDEQARFCTKDSCWLKLYLAQQADRADC